MYVFTGVTHLTLPPGPRVLILTRTILSLFQVLCTLAFFHPFSYMRLHLDFTTFTMSKLVRDAVVSALRKNQLCVSPSSLFKEMQGCWRVADWTASDPWEGGELLTHRVSLTFPCVFCFGFSWGFAVGWVFFCSFVCCPVFVLCEGIYFIRRDLTL